MLKKAMVAYLRHHRNNAQNKAAQIPHGKVKIKDLIGQNSGIENIEITDKNIKSFEKIARKYNIDYSLKRDKSQTPSGLHGRAANEVCDLPKYYVFFKAHDTNAITMAFKEYTQKTLNKKRRKPSLINRIRRNMQKVKQQGKQKEQQKQLLEAQKLIPAPKKADMEL